MLPLDHELDVGVRPGDVVLEKYRVERVLAVGGMGVVLLAHHLQLDEKVALKFLLPKTLRNAEAVSRFAREARAAVKIKSEHVARVIDVGALENGAPFMVMEYLEGEDLATWVEKRGPLPYAEAALFVLEACEALAEAHALGIIHRDLKPSNLFAIRRADGELSVKVLDFGISKMIDPSSVTGGATTRTSALIGSPYYMSPEQLRSSRDVDAQTDVWALGVILFEVITGRRPFGGESVTDIAITIFNDASPRLRDLRPDVPSELEVVVATCLEKGRSQRYANVAELAVDLLPFAREASPGRAVVAVERIAGTTRNARGASVPPPKALLSATGLPPAGGTVLTHAADTAFATTTPASEPPVSPLLPPSAAIPAPRASVPSVSMHIRLHPPDRRMRFRSGVGVAASGVVFVALGTALVTEVIAPALRTKEAPSSHAAPIQPDGGAGLRR